MPDQLAPIRIAAARGGWEDVWRIWQGALALAGDLDVTAAGGRLAMHRLAGQEESAPHGETHLPSPLLLLMLEYAWAAFDQGQNDLALRRFEALRMLAPEALLAESGIAAVCLRLNRVNKAEEVLASCLTRFPARPEWLLNHAISAEKAQNWPLALARWEAVLAALPGNAMSYFGAVNAAQCAGLPERAAELLAMGERQFNTFTAEWFPLRCRHAAAAASSGNLLEALRHWTRLRENFPGEAAAHLGLAGTLTQLGRRAAANSLLSEAAAQFPGNIALALEYAELASRRGNWPEAARRWALVCTRFPDHQTGHERHVQALRNAECLAEAEDAAAAAIRHFPGNAALAMDFAALAMDARKFTEAARRWLLVIETFPALAAGYSGAAEALIAAGDVAGAEPILATAVKKFAAEPAVWIAHARAASLQGDWRLAAERLALARRNFPANPAILDRWADAEQVTRLDEMAAPRPEPRAAAKPRAALTPVQEADQALFKGFESLGDNCEFGLVQRHFGIEPLGLLRWGSVTPANLVRGLEQEFVGLWEPENVSLLVRPEEIFLEDRTYGISMHSFIVNDPDPQRLHLQLCTRLKFLARKLLEDLGAAKKIFIYKTSAGLMAETEMTALHGAMRRFGDNRLLCVRPSPARVNEVRLLAEGLALGEIDRLSPQLVRAEIGYQSWREICRHAVRVFRPEVADAG